MLSVVAPRSLPYSGMLGHAPNISPGYTGLPQGNALAYLAQPYVAKKNLFVNMAPWGPYYKTYTALINFLLW